MKLVPLSSEHLDDVIAIEQSNQYSPWPEQEFVRSMENPNRHAWVALDNNQVLGFAVFSKIGLEAELLTVSIARQHQGQGLGRELLQQTITKLECETLFLEVRTSNDTARQLYESMGFNEVGRRANYYPTKNGREDALIYAADRRALID